MCVVCIKNHVVFLGKRCAKRVGFSGSRYQIEDDGLLRHYPSIDGFMKKGLEQQKQVNWFTQHHRGVENRLFFRYTLAKHHV